MISIQSAMLVALGFLAASLLGLLLASALWSRAVRLTTVRIKQSMPISEQEIQADRDRLRAEYAVKVHKLESQLEQARLLRARQLIEFNRRDATISALETGMAQLRLDLEEQLNARRVLEQTIADRLPKVEERLAEARRLLANREREMAELHEGAKQQKLALDEAAAINAQQAAHIERLTGTLASRGKGSDISSEMEIALRSELEALRAKARDQAGLIDRLQRSVVTGPTAIPETKSSGKSAEAGKGRPAKDASHEKELRALRAKTEDQEAEIAGLKAALAAFEKDAGKDGDDTRAALKARLGSAQAQSDSQTAIIGRLRAELASVNERLARQAAQFMDEVRRTGAGAAPASSLPRAPAPRPERGSLAERVARIRSAPAAPPAEKPAGAPAADVRKPEKPNDASLNGGTPKEPAPAPALPAAEKPKGGDIPVGPRRLRLLDRITSLAKE